MVFSMLQVEQLKRSKRMCANFSEVGASFKTNEKSFASSRCFRSWPKMLGKNTSFSARLHQESQLSQNGFRFNTATVVRKPMPMTVSASMHQIQVSSVPRVFSVPEVPQVPMPRTCCTTAQTVSGWKSSLKSPAEYLPMTESCSSQKTQLE